VDDQIYDMQVRICKAFANSSRLRMLDVLAKFPSVVTVVRNTLRPFTIGDDHPRPGISTAHSTFSVLDHFSGNLPFATTGFASGPRNLGHSGSTPHAAPKLSTITLETT
jgi:hypothetical protein